VVAFLPVAYAYMMYSAIRLLSEVARKLVAMRDFTGVRRGV
jgi:hypothetical protein